MLRTTLFTMLLGGALLGASSTADAQRRRDRDEDRRARLDTTLSISRGGLVELEGASGEMVVTGWDRDEVRILATSEESDLRIDATGSRIQVKGIGMHWDDVHFEVSVPRGTRLLMNGHSSDITVNGSRGTVEIRTQNGDIELTDVGDVDVNALNGDVELESVGAVRINLVAGDVDMISVRGPIEVTTVSGDVDVRSATSERVAIETTSGEVFYAGDIAQNGRYELSSHSGNVTVRVPASVSAAVSLQTYSGEIESDFPITLQGGATIGGAPRTFDFRIGSGSARLTLISFSGSVLLQRADTSNR